MNTTEGEAEAEGGAEEDVEPQEPEPLYCARIARLAYKHPSAYHWQDLALLRSVQPYFIDHQESQCIVFQGREAKQLVFAFRGTDSSYDVLRSLHVAKVPLFIKGTFCGHVHHGFYSYYQLIRRQVIEQARLFISESPDQPHDFLFIGHSLGGCCALAALECSFLQQEMAAPLGIKCYTYGSPKLGDGRFAQEMAARVPSYFRYIHHMDPIPNCPTSMCFRHTGKVVPLGRPLTRWQKCMSRSFCFWTWSSCMSTCFEDHSIDMYIDALANTS